MTHPRKKRGERTGDRSDYDPYLLRAVEIIDRMMRERGVTQTELADWAKVDQGAISKLLSGDRPEASFAFVVRLLIAFRTSIDWAVADPPPPALPASIANSTPAPPPSQARPSRPASK